MPHAQHVARFEGSGITRRSFFPSLRPPNSVVFYSSTWAEHMFSRALITLSWGIARSMRPALCVKRQLDTFSANWWCGSLQININNFGNRGTSDAAVPLMPNPSIRFTGRTEIIASLKEHFLNSPNDQVQKRKYFLLYGMGGIGKTQICLKFIEEMLDQWVPFENHVWPLFLKFNSLPVFLLFYGLMHLLLAPSHRGLKVSVTFLKLSPLHWMGH